MTISHIVHYSDVIMSVIASQITSLTIVYLTVNSGADQRKHQSSASVAYVWGIAGDRWQRASNAENVSIWWRHHGSLITWSRLLQCHLQILLHRLEWEMRVCWSKVVSNVPSDIKTNRATMKSKLINCINTLKLSIGKLYSQSFFW